MHPPDDSTATDEFEARSTTYRGASVPLQYARQLHADIVGVDKHTRSNRAQEKASLQASTAASFIAVPKSSPPIGGDSTRSYDASQDTKSVMASTYLSPPRENSYSSYGTAQNPDSIREELEKAFASNSVGWTFFEDQMRYKCSTYWNFAEMCFDVHIMANPHQGRCDVTFFQTLGDRLQFTYALGHLRSHIPSWCSAGTGASQQAQENTTLTRTKEIVAAVEEPLIRSLHSRFADEQTEALETMLTLSTTSPALFFAGDKTFPLVGTMEQLVSERQIDQQKLHLAMVSLVGNLAASPAVADSPAAVDWISRCIPRVLETALDAENQHLRREAVRALLTLLRNYANLRQTIVSSAHIMHRIELESLHQEGRCPDAALESHAREFIIVSGAAS